MKKVFLIYFVTVFGGSFLAAADEHYRNGNDFWGTFKVLLFILNVVFFSMFFNKSLSLWRISRDIAAIKENAIKHK